MSQAITIDLPDELANWVEQKAHRLGIPVEQVVREQLEEAHASAATENESRPFMRLAGMIQGAPNLSTRQGFTPG